MTWSDIWFQKYSVSKVEANPKEGAPYRLIINRRICPKKRIAELAKEQKPVDEYVNSLPSYLHEMITFLTDLGKIE